MLAESGRAKLASSAAAAAPLTFPTLRDVVAHYVNNGAEQQQTAFLCSYSCFCSGEELMDQIEALFAAKEAPEERVVAFLDRWARVGRVDFKHNTALADRLVLWMSNNLESHESDAVKLVFIARDAVAPLPDDMNVMLPVPSSQSAVNHKFLDWTNMRIAEHLTVIEADIYNRILPQEFTDLAWQRDNKEELAPNLVRLAERFNSVAFWVAATIVFAPEPPRTTQQVVSKWLSVAWTLWKMGNFQSMLAVVSGLTHGAVQRLKQVWSALPPKYQERFAQLDQLFSPLHGYKNYRDAIAKTAALGGPVIPYMPAVLGDLAMQSVGNPTRVDGQINGEKIAMVGARIFDALRYQPARFSIAAPDPSLIMYFLSTTLSGTTEDHLYEESMRREPVKQHDLSPGRSESPSKLSRRNSGMIGPGQGSPAAGSTGSISRIFSKVRARRGSVFMAPPSGPAPAVPAHIGVAAGRASSASSPNLKAAMGPSPAAGPAQGAALSKSTIVPIPISSGSSAAAAAAAADKARLQAKSAPPVSVANASALKQQLASIEHAKAAILSLSHELEDAMLLRKAESAAPATKTRLHRSGSWPLERPRMKLPKEEEGVALPLINAPTAKRRPVMPPPAVPPSPRQLLRSSTLPASPGGGSPKDRSPLASPARQRQQQQQQPQQSPKRAALPPSPSLPPPPPLPVTGPPKGKEEEEETESEGEDDTSSAVSSHNSPAPPRRAPAVVKTPTPPPPVSRILFPLPSAEGSPVKNSPTSGDVLTMRASKDQLASAEQLKATKDPKSWTGKEVGVWLGSLGLGGYAPLFADNCITGADLVDLTDADLVELGMRKIGHKKMLLAGVLELFADNSAMAQQNRLVASSSLPLSPRSTSGSAIGSRISPASRSPRSPGRGGSDPGSARAAALNLRLVSGRNLQDVLFVKIRFGGKVTVVEASRLLSFAELQSMCAKVAGRGVRTVHAVDADKELTLLKGEKDLEFVLDSLKTSSFSVVVNN